MPDDIQLNMVAQHRRCSFQHLWICIYHKLTLPPPKFSCTHCDVTSFCVVLLGIKVKQSICELLFVFSDLPPVPSTMTTRRQRSTICRRQSQSCRQEKNKTRVGLRIPDVPGIQMVKDRVGFEWHSKFDLKS